MAFTHLLSNKKALLRGIITLLVLVCLRNNIQDNPASFPALSASPPTPNFRGGETTHDGNKLCIALVNDGKITTASIISEGGQYVNLLLPTNYEGHLTMECTLTNQTTGEVVTTEGSHKKQLIVAREPTGCPINSVTSMYYEPGFSVTNCANHHNKGFQPGYLDQTTNDWYYFEEYCLASGANVRVSRWINTLPHKTRLAKEDCPALELPSSPSSFITTKKDIWISFIGDSVTRQVFLRILTESGIPGKEWIRTLNNKKESSSNSKGGGGGVHPDLILGMIDTTKYQIWFSFTHEFISPVTLMGRWGMPLTWGDFVEARGMGVEDGDPAYANDRVPDYVFYNPGYCSSDLNAMQFGNAIDGILNRWERGMTRYVSYNNNAITTTTTTTATSTATTTAKMPKMHVMLNMMPAPWMIPDQYAADRPHRTQLNEYRKNLAIISTVKKYDFVDGVMDLFSIELPFNGHPGGDFTAHRDAVHIGDPVVLRIASNLIIDKLCEIPAE